MKGTAALDKSAALGDSKNRAEHVMIVDLLRNDLSTFCERVVVEELFTHEHYPTYVTLTSTIAGYPRRPPTLQGIMRALFPCGSVVGAPKIAALHMIAALETRGREAYCGTIGWAAPDGRLAFNVAIRTLQIDRRTGHGRLDVGGGIVADSTSIAEWEEVIVKRRFYDALVHAQRALR